MKRLAAAVASGTLMTVLLLTIAPAAHATAPGKNGRIAFRRYLNSAHTHGAIFTINPDGTRERQVTHPPQGIVTNEPDWSPGGRWIVYQTLGPDAPSRMYKIRANGTHRTYLSGSCTGGPQVCGSDNLPAWSPDGHRIAFQREFCGLKNAMSAIYVEQANGTHARQVTQQKATCSSHRWEDDAPTWAPTGNRLAFQRLKRGTDRRAIFTVRLDGTGLRRLTPWRLEADQPDWSPNGHWIVFRSKESSDDSGNVWLVHPDGSGLHAVTRTPPGSGKWLSTTFSPNGRRITAGKFPGDGAAGNADVYVMRLDGSHRNNVTNSFAWESAPDWGPQPK
jgi:Tol biopolymer transport system component